MKTLSEQSLSEAVETLNHVCRDDFVLMPVVHTDEMEQAFFEALSEPVVDFSAVYAAILDAAQEQQ